jgi:hypothetical protein
VVQPLKMRIKAEKTADIVILPAVRLLVDSLTGLTAAFELLFILSDIFFVRKPINTITAEFKFNFVKKI